MHPKWAVVALVFVAGAAHADGVLEDARKDYEAGAAAYDRRDWATAATRFSRADERVPNPRALQLAMASATHLTDAPLAMSLVERAERRAVDGTLAELAKRLRTRFAKEVGHVRVVCSKCEASVNGHAGLSHWLTPGSYRVKFESGEKEVSVTAGAEVEVSPPPPPALPIEEPPADKPIEPIAPPPPPPPPPPAAEPRGLRPWIFWTGVGATAAGAVAGSVLTVRSKSAHDDFVAMPNETTAAAGDAAQTRAAIAWGVTGALFLATVVVAILTDFK